MSVRLGTVLLAGSSSNDNVSITKNSSNKLQSIGIIDQNDTTKSIKTWVGTRAEYEELVDNDEIDYNTVYNITDDSENTLMTLLSDVLYPVGSIYMGTMATCPLAALFGTWILVSSGRVLQGADGEHVAGTTIEAGLPNITGRILNREIMSAHKADDEGSIYTESNNYQYYGNLQNTDTTFGGTLVLDASRSSSIYGNSDTVQPPAYCVNIWKRVE